MNLRVEQVRPTNWDRTFSVWTAHAIRQGLDPNEIGDKEWAADRLYESLDRFVCHRCASPSYWLHLPRCLDDWVPALHPGGLRPLKPRSG